MVAQKKRKSWVPDKPGPKEHKQERTWEALDDWFRGNSNNCWLPGTENTQIVPLTKGQGSSL